MSINTQKMELNKSDIYENARRDISRRQTVHSSKNVNSTSGNPEMMNTKHKKVYSSCDHYYHDNGNSIRMPTYNYHKYLKDWMEYHNIERDYKVLKVKNRIKEENEMLQNEMTRIRNMRKITDL